MVDLVGGYVVAHLKRDIVQLGEKLRRILFSKCICFYWFLVFLKFWIFWYLKHIFLNYYFCDFWFSPPRQSSDNSMSETKTKIIVKRTCDIVTQCLDSNCAPTALFWGTLMENVMTFLEYFPNPLFIWQPRYTHTHIMNKFHMMNSHPIMIFHSMSMMEYPSYDGCTS